MPAVLLETLFSSCKKFQSKSNGELSFKRKTKTVFTLKVKQTKSGFSCSLFIFPRAGPDIKYFLGFVRTQLSTTTTIALVFGPKVFIIIFKCLFLFSCVVQIIRVLRGQGDQWDNRARSRGVTASFSLNGIGLVPEEAPDLYQENEELKVKFCFIYFKLKKKAN